MQNASFNITVVLKVFSLQHLWKCLLDLRRTSNMNSMKTHIVNVLFIDDRTKKNMHHLMWYVGLFIHYWVKPWKNLWNCHLHLPYILAPKPTLKLKKIIKSGCQLIRA